MPPDDLLERADATELVKWLSLFAAEARNGKGNHYTPATISQLMAGILRFMRSVNPSAPNILDKKDSRFKALHNTLDNLYHKLRTMNVGAEIKHAEVFTKEDESLLWESGTLGLNSPQALLHAVFYLNGKNFCLRGGEEHRSIKISQIKRCDDPPSYTYVENGSKNRNGTFSQRYVPNKTVPVHANPMLKERCHVVVLDKYLTKIPKTAFEKDVFYLRPLPRVPTNQDLPWFTSSPIGRNELSKMVQKFCTEAGISGNKTNHSLRATGASQLFQAHVPEKIIQERTGHRSLEALRLYERTTTEQHQAVSQVLGSDVDVSYQSVVQKESNNMFLPQHTLPPSANTASPIFNMSGCTVNICFNPAPPPPPPPFSDITKEELDELLQGFPA